MPNILTLENVSKSFENRLLLDSVTGGIDSGDRLGVIGVNGTGKSTLLAIIAGALEPDDGQVIRSNGLRISFLPQNPEFDNSLTILENVCGAISGKHEYWDTTGEARAMLERFGITETDRKPDTLSGGQRKRAALAAALLTPADLLILDEPTNHLDSAMIEWLQDFLARYRGALLMVTHDRYFLDQVTGGILEIDRGKLYRYAENYSGYLERKAERMNAAIAAERKAQALYRKDLAWILRGARARSTKQKAHIQRFEALRDREKPVEEAQLQMASVSSRLGGKTIELDHVAAGYDGKPLFHDFSYIFLKNDRIGIIGPNGCGKSTLIKTITGELPPLAGTVETGQTVKIGVFSQENDLPDEGGTRVIDCVRDVAEFIRTPDGYVSAANMCEQFLFDGNMQYTPVRKLSGGEKRWTSPPTIWISRLCGSWRTIWTALRVSSSRCPTTGISWTGWCGAFSPSKETGCCTRTRAAMRSTASGSLRRAFPRTMPAASARWAREKRMPAETAPAGPTQRRKRCPTRTSGNTTGSRRRSTRCRRSRTGWQRRSWQRHRITLRLRR